MQPVISPPVRKEIRRGLRLEKSLAGETTLAATFVVRVAIRIAISAIKATTGRLKRPIRATGSQIASPKMTTDAEVTATPINEYSVIVSGRPSACPSAWSLGERAYRVKSGIL